MPKDKIIYVDEPYTCVDCGRQNLKFSETSYQESPDGQLIEGTVLCMACFFRSPDFQSVLKEGPEAQKVVGKLIKRFEYNYDRRMVRRVLPTKKKQ